LSEHAAACKLDILYGVASAGKAVLQVGVHALADAVESTAMDG